MIDPVGSPDVGAHFDRLVDAIDAVWQARDRIERDRLPQTPRVEIDTISLRGNEPVSHVQHQVWRQRIDRAIAARSAHEGLPIRAILRDALDPALDAAYAALGAIRDALAPAEDVLSVSIIRDRSRMRFGSLHVGDLGLVGAMALDPAVVRSRLLRFEREISGARARFAGAPADPGPRPLHYRLNAQDLTRNLDLPTDIKSLFKGFLRVDGGSLAEVGAISLAWALAVIPDAFLAKAAQQTPPWPEGLSLEVVAVHKVALGAD